MAAAWWRSRAPSRSNAGRDQHFVLITANQTSSRPTSRKICATWLSSMSLSHTTLNGLTMTRILYLLLPGLLASCAVGPNYNPAKNKVASAFANSAQPGLVTNDTVIAWWRGFNDAQLNELVDRAIASNHDLRIATTNLIE